MPVITFSSPKGGCGKTTAATILASMLAEQGAKVTIIDADPNHNVLDWAELSPLPRTLTVIGDAEENTIIDKIEEASAVSSFVIVDLEGTASLIAANAISYSDLVIIPVQGSQLDAKQAGRQIALVKTQEMQDQRRIPFAVLMTKTNPAIVPHTLKHIIQKLNDMAIPVMKTRLHDREAYRSIFSYGGSLQSLSKTSVSNLNGAISNAAEFTAEVVQLLRDARAEDAAQEVA